MVSTNGILWLAKQAYKTSKKEFVQVKGFFLFAQVKSRKNKQRDLWVVSFDSRISTEFSGKLTKLALLGASWKCWQNWKWNLTATANNATTTKRRRRRQQQTNSWLSKIY